MLNNTQMTEVLKRTSKAINCTMHWLSDDKKEDLAQIVGMQKAVWDYKPTQNEVYFAKKVAETQAKLAKCDNDAPCYAKLTNLLAAYQEQVNNLDTVPCVEYLKIIAIRQAYKPGNYIAVKGQRIAEKEAAELEKVLTDLNFDGVTSRHAVTFQTVSFDELQKSVGFEPTCHRLNPEEALIEAQENAINQKQVDNVKNSPFYAGYLQLAINHFNEGGNMNTYAASLGMSGQSAINRLKRMAREANDTEKPMLPFEAVADTTVVYVPVRPTKKRIKTPVTATSDDQLTLF